MPVIFLTLLAGCHPRSPAGRPVPDTVPPVIEDSARPDTGGSAPATASMAIEPSVRILGVPGMEIDKDPAFVPAYGSDPSAILLQNGKPVEGYPSALIVPGALDRGTYVVTDVWDGVSSFDGGTAGGIVAGDADDDGHLDLWLGDELYLGPLLGKELKHRENAAAWFDGGIEGFAVAADFDADGDGHEDVILMDGGQTGFLYYGPFSGQIPGLLAGDADPSQVTVLGTDGGCFGQRMAFRLRDHLGPGQDLIGIGAGGDCGGPDTAFYPLQQPRGTHLSRAEAVATSATYQASTVMEYSDAGDLDGDGWRDVLYADMVHGMFFGGPLSGELGYSAPFVVDIEPLTDVVTRAIPDLDGDGLPELIGYGGEWDWVFLKFSPHADPIHVYDGLPIASAADMHPSAYFGSRTPDLDGDGLIDLIDARYEGDDASDPNLAGAGEIRIWYGKDLLAAWQTYQTTP